MDVFVLLGKMLMSLELITQRTLRLNEVFSGPWKVEGSF